MTKRGIGIAVGAAGVALLLAGAGITVTVLTEAYGAGPPYYSRTTNMDKWTNPLPYVIALDVMVFGITALAIRFALKSVGTSH